MKYNRRIRTSQVLIATINMVDILTPGSPWQQASSACFLLGAMFMDILLIRIFLFLAYTFLLTNGICGFPSWPNYEWTGSIGLDTIIWSCLNLIVHGCAIAQLLYDERPITFKDEDERQIAVYLLRRGGMQAMEASIALSHGNFRTIRKGECILDPIQALRKVALLLEGKCHYIRCDKDGETTNHHLYSGMAFDFRLFNIFGVYLGFEAPVSFEVFADTDCLVFEWDTEALDTLAYRSGPSVSSYFRNFIMAIMATEWEFRTHGEPKGITAATSRGTREPIEYFDGQRSVDFTDPLEEWEVRHSSVRGVLTWIWKSFEPFMPPGTRHWTLPTSGLLAKKRTVQLWKASENLIHANTSSSEMRSMVLNAQTLGSAEFDKLGNTV